jgi:hypothetical protein
MHPCRQLALAWIGVVVAPLCHGRTGVDIFMMHAIDGDGRNAAVGGAGKVIPDPPACKGKTDSIFGGIGPTYRAVVRAVAA